MISAAEARKISNENSYYAVMWDEIDKQVREVASKGKKCLMYELKFVMTEQIFKDLAPKFFQLGYEIAWFPAMNKLQIMWWEEI